MYLNICVSNEVKELYNKVIKNYNSKTQKDSGFDLIIPDVISNKSYQKTEPITIDHKIKIALYDEKGNPQPYYLYPRSCITKTPFRLANSIGIIDSGYRGNIIARVDCTYTSPEFIINKGDRLFQICAPNLQPFAGIIITETLNKTERGDKGFGSSGNYGIKL